MSQAKESRNPSFVICYLVCLTRPRTPLPRPWKHPVDRRLPRLQAGIPEDPMELIGPEQDEFLVWARRPRAGLWGAPHSARARTSLFCREGGGAPRRGLRGPWGGG
ncbi:MAG: hypothetical protein QGG53_36420, partial [Planctomycetota bacterium]|nr:hypothetical protein [Planctomycetota bacterium]